MSPRRIKLRRCSEAPKPSVPRTRLVAQVGNSAECVVEAVGEVGSADNQSKLNNLTFVVILEQLLERTGADRGGAAGDTLGVKNRGLFFFVEA